MINIFQYVDILHPKKHIEVINKNKERTSIKPSFYNIFIAALIMVLISSLQAMAFKQYIQQNPPKEPLQMQLVQQQLLVINQITSPAFMAVSLFFFILFFYVLLYLFHFGLVLFRCKGNFKGLAYLISVLFTSFVVLSLAISIIISFFNNGTDLNLIFGLLQILLLFYFVYIFYDIVKIVYNLSTWGTVGALILFAFIFVVLSMLPFIGK